MKRWYGEHAAGRALLLGTMLMATTGCGRFYWFKSAATQADFNRDSTSCANEAGLTPEAGRYGIVIHDVYRACLRAKGWVRKQQVEPPPQGWYRGVE